MILGIDIGNTRTTFALVRDLSIVDEEHIPSGRVTFRRAHEALRKLRDRAPDSTLDGAGIASVVPHLTELVRNAVVEVTGVQPVVVTPLTAGIPTSYATPDAIGADRLCNAIAAFEAVHGGAIVIDCGTAVTLDCIDAQGAFLGGAILPGYRSASRALSSITAQLPDIILTAPERGIGTSTDECLRSGIVLGTTYAIEGLLGRIISESFSDEFPALIVTGGHAELFASTTALTVKIMPDLVQQGIALTVARA